MVWLYGRSHVRMCQLRHNTFRKSSHARHRTKRTRDTFCRSGNCIREVLLGHGANPNVCTGARSSQSGHLIVACLHSGVEVVKLLIKHGADVLQSGAIQAAVMANRIGVLDVLYEHGASVNERLLLPIKSSREKKLMTRIESETPLHICCEV
jgi:ankyrin repeat protein